MSLFLGLANTAQAALRDLQAHGSAERLWLARAEPRAGATGNPPTALFVRSKHDQNWRRLDSIESPVLGLASRGPQLAILLSNGDWLLTTDTGPTSGLPLPNKAHMVAIGSDAETLWAVGLARPAGAAGTANAPPATGPSSRPASTPSTAPAPAPAPATALEKEAVPTTAPSAATRPAAGMRAAPATAPSPGGMTLYRLGPLEWESQGPLPEEIPAAEGVSVSLAVVGGKPVVAHKVGDRLVRVFRRTDRGKWEVLGDVPTPSDLQDYRALEGGPGPVVWTRGVTGPSRLWIAGALGDDKPTERELIVPGRDVQADHAVAFANGALRMLWVEDNKIFEQRLNPATGAPDGDPAPLPIPTVSLDPGFARWLQIVVMAALIFAMAASIRRRQEMQDAGLDPAKLPLAPLSTRLAAGVIDTLPALAAFWLVPVEQTDPREQGMIKVLIGFAVYIVLTTLVEVLAGRSLGKMATGLRVVGLDGKPAGPGPRLVRNLLRVIDMPVAFALILFSPLRQRAGDLAAGTLVVGSKVAAEAVPTEEAEAVGAGTAATRPQNDQSMAKPD